MLLDKLCWLGYRAIESCFMYKTYCDVITFTLVYSSIGYYVCIRHITITYKRLSASALSICLSVCLSPKCKKRDILKN